MSVLLSYPPPPNPLPPRGGDIPSPLTGEGQGEGVTLPGQKLENLFSE